MRYETRAAIGCFKNRTIRKTDVREDDLSRVSVRSTGGHSKPRSGFNQIAPETYATHIIHVAILNYSTVLSLYKAIFEVHMNGWCYK